MYTTNIETHNGLNKMSKYYISKMDLDLIQTEEQIIQDLKKDFELEYKLIDAGFTPQCFNEILAWVLKDSWMAISPRLVKFAKGDLTIISSALKKAVSGDFKGLSEFVDSKVA